jgi:hypothetical protein
VTTLVLPSFARCRIIAYIESYDDSHEALSQRKSEGLTGAEETAPVAGLPMARSAKPELVREGPAGVLSEAPAALDAVLDMLVIRRRLYRADCWGPGLLVASAFAPLNRLRPCGAFSSGGVSALEPPIEGRAVLLVAVEARGAVIVAVGAIV